MSVNSCGEALRFVDRRNTKCSKWDGLLAKFGAADLQAMWVADMDFQAPQCVRDALKAYLEERKLIQTDKANENALFLSLQKKRMTQRAVQIMVKKYCAIAVPLKKRMSPHKLRSTYATRLYHETEDIYLVADALGHSDVNTTRKHYAAMSDQRRREAARNVHLPEMDNQTNTNDENRLKMEKQAGKTPEMDS